MIERYLCIVLFISVQSLYGQDTAAFYATKDTYINTVIADKIQGEVQSMIASAWTYSGTFGRGRSLLGFEVCELPGDFELIKANLYLYYDYSSSHVGHTKSGLNNAKLYKITSYWDESTTWASQPEYDESVFASLAAPLSTNQNYKVDVTDVVEEALKSSKEIGFYLKLDDEVKYRSLVFASRNHQDGEIHPRLELIYTTEDSRWCENNVISEGNAVQNALDECAEQILVPNVFSPNKDWVNDFFRVNEISCDYDGFSVQIMNRWGVLVYESSTQSFSWDGQNQNNGQPVSDGTYFYSLTIHKNGYKSSKMGTITIVR